MLEKVSETLSGMVHPTRGFGMKLVKDNNHETFIDDMSIHILLM